MTDTVRTHVTGGVATVTLNRPAKKNALTTTMYAALADALQAAELDADVRAVVLRGDETVFCAGNDVADFLDHPQAGPEAPAYRFLRAIARFPKPVVAAVCGPAVGIGATMLLHCDLVYAGESATLLFPFVDLGLVPEAGSSLLLPELVGRHRAAEALLLGDPIPAAAALDAGLVNQVLPDAEVLDLAHAQAARLAAKPVASVIETKRLMRAGDQDAVLARIEAEGAVFARLLDGPEARSALTSFLRRDRSGPAAGPTAGAASAGRPGPR
ncbi:enoyl-CoA hydratase [Isoptericola cucumis]|uniref:Enoyl-CoA hydratase n=1 Tax=Isoptericola cucumis TaxID=1776856 RepID=A0ABQ2BBB7_9MICO|nr:enoyl-CoA hydratase [Isoptericola cucumis]GGI10016.1 enoyl-CoA hydratase [Isoptericola cucumis]